MVRATYSVEVRWDGSNWTDETSRVRSVYIKRGRWDETVSVEMGTCVVELKDLEARYNYLNASSPIAADLKPLRRIRVRATDNAVVYPLFYGFLRRIEAHPGPTSGFATFECVDLFYLLESARPVVAVPAPTFTGIAIGTILDGIDWDAGLRDLDVGDSLVDDYEADGTDTALTLIQQLLEAERGTFYAAADGDATYEDRHASNRTPRTSSQSTIDNTMRAMAPGVDVELVRNRATVTKAGGVAQTYTDAASVADYHYRDFSPITTPYLESDIAAALLAEYLVVKRKDPVSPMRFLDLNNGQAVPFTALLARELGDRVTVAEDITGASNDYHIRGIEHEIEGGGAFHRGSWALEARDTMQPFIIDVSLIDSTTDKLTY
jgi:hypothetical protein